VTRFLRRALRLVFHHAGWKLLALAVAVALWAVVSNEPELATFVSVPLEYKDLPGDLEISSNLLESVYLELRGSSSEMRGLGDVRRPAVVLDMAGVRPGEHTFSVGDRNVRLPRGLRLVRAIPSQAHFEIERRTSRVVPVRVRFGSARQAGYDVDRYAVSPAQLTVLGPESHVARINHVVTDPIDLSGVVGRNEFRVNAFVEDSYVRFQSTPTLVVDVTMKKK
jgi:YbbR domain-containing protein